MSDLATRVIHYCQKHSLLSPNDRIVVGVSGGPDSLCLLHVLNTVAGQFGLQVAVAHLNHQLRAEAAADQDFVEKISADWQLPVFVATENVTELAHRQNKSIEAAARLARYEFLYRIAVKTGARSIAVGHNADDQTETILMHLIRGSGLDGLQGMQPKVAIRRLITPPQATGAASLQEDPFLIRPLLDTPRTEIEAYCHKNGLAPRRDHSNQDPTFLRNRIRHHLLPELQTYNPNFRATTRRLANIVGAEIEHLEAEVEDKWPEIVKTESPGKIEFDLKKWAGLTLALQRRMFRLAIKRVKGDSKDLGFEHLEAALATISTGQTGASVPLPANLQLTISYDTLALTNDTAMPTPNLPLGPYLLANQQVTIGIPGVTKLPDTNWHLYTTLLDKSQVDRAGAVEQTGREAYLDARIVGAHPILRTRQAGDTFTPSGLEYHTKKLKDYFIDQKIPAAQRDFIPILVNQSHQILWVCGYRLAENALVRPDTTSVVHLTFEQIE
ncbi:MAG: tRNA lysidine(34) synthetase TilS [Anaerolineae bacterium]|nr:tRNA lysidine(34) synthetase TilS [Anaerolineae bacterium]